MCAFPDFEPQTRSIEAFGRKVTATASHLMGDGAIGQHYHSALGELQRELRSPTVQRGVFSLSRLSPSELMRGRISVSELQHRALAYVPDDLLYNIPEASSSPFSLFQGFQATLPEIEEAKKKRHGRHNSKDQKLLSEGKHADEGAPSLSKLRNDKQGLDHRLEMMKIRKNMCSTEIREIDNKIGNLNTMRGIVLERLAGLEQEETLLERETLEVESKLEDMQEKLDDAAALASQATTAETPLANAADVDASVPDSPAEESSFMSESIYQKLPSPKVRRPKVGRRKTNFILHEHLKAGSNIRELQAHNDMITALDFDVPFGTMVTAALDDTVRVWDLNAGRCMGLLEGHLSSVRCLQVEDNMVATGSMDASVRLWDLNQADYTPPVDNHINKSSGDDDDDLAYPDESSPPFNPPASSMRDCPVFTLSAHVAEVTALHFRNSTLVSGSADKTLRQWDLEKGRCVQTLDVLWAAAQASSTVSAPGSNSNADFDQSGLRRATGRVSDTSADFVGALQVFDAALACGTADGLVRLWDLRSGQVSRSLVGHTGPVTCLQFDDVHLVTGSLDRSIRVC